jgi:hypothetical protein
LEKKRLLFCLFSILFALSGKAQTTIEGTVKDTVNNPIQAANIFVQQDKNTGVLSYAYTDGKGYYRLILQKPGTYLLNVSSLSFRKEQIIFFIDSLEAQIKIVKDFILTPEPFALSEVVVNAEVPILVKKDTITFKVDSFTDGSEEVVEDVLKKLPGIEVANDGSIQVQGRNIQKVMVEGDDLFEKGYKLLTKNLDAGVMDKVEILEHYSDNALLKNIEDSDEVALNIILKEDKKSTLFGNASMGYGTEKFYENRLNLIAFKDKTKYYFFGNLNNNGSDAIGDIYQILYPDLLSDVNYIGDGESAQNMVAIGENSPALNESRHLFNNAELASLNGIYNPNKDLKIKGLFFMTTDENKLFQNSLETFIIPPNSFVNSVNYASRKNSLAGSGKWDALFNIDKNAQIEYVGRYNFGRFNSNAALLFNEESIFESLKNRTKFTDQRLTYTNKINERRALQITGRYIVDTKPQDYTVDTFLYNDLFPEFNGIDMAAQNSRHKMRFYGLEGSYFINTPKSYLNLRAGIAQKNNQLTSDLIFTDSLNNRYDAGDDFKNRLTYDVMDLYLKAQYKYSLKSVSFRSVLELHQYQVSVSKGSTTDKTNPLNAIPSLGLSWQINKKNRILSTYKYSTVNLPFEQLFQGYLLSNYRNFRKGFGSFEQIRGSIFLTNYVLGNWSDSFLVHSSLLYNKDHDYISSNNIVQANYSLYSPIKLKDREFYSFDLSADKFIEKISSNFKINLSYSSNVLQNIVNTSSLRPVSSITYSYGGELRSAFNGLIDFHIGTTWSESVVTVSQKNRNTNNYSFFDLDFRLSEKISVEIENERYYFGNLAGDKSTFFSDLNARYDILKNKLKVKLVCSNLFNNDTFSTLNISDTGSYSASYRLLPRYFLLSLDYRF